MVTVSSTTWFDIDTRSCIGGNIRLQAAVSFMSHTPYSLLHMLFHPTTAKSAFSSGLRTPLKDRIHPFPGSEAVGFP